MYWYEIYQRENAYKLKLLTGPQRNILKKLRKNRLCGVNYMDADIGKILVHASWINLILSTKSSKKNN